MQPQIHQLHTIQPGPIDQPGRRLRHHHLPTMRRRRDPCRPVHIHPHITAVMHHWAAGVHPDPHPHRLTSRPLRYRQLPLRLRHRRDGLRRGRKDHEEAVPLGAHLRPTVRHPGLAQHQPMSIQRLRIGRPQPRQQRRRTLNIGEHHRHSARRQLTHRHIIADCRWGLSCFMAADHHTPND